MTDDELNQRFDALMTRLNNAQETIIERVRACETSIAALTEVWSSRPYLRGVTDMEK